MDARCGRAGSGCVSGVLVMKGCPWYVPDSLCDLAVEEGKKEAKSIMAHVFLAALVLWLVVE